MRYAMMIELDKCIGCQACVSACKQRWGSGPGANRDWVKTYTHGRRQDSDVAVTFYPGLCNHCEQHPCTQDCPTGATYMSDNGIVMVDADVCIGCGNCVPACPYGARHPDPVKGIVEKCNFCAPYLARGESPACVSTCLAQCRHIGDLDDKNGSLAQFILQRNAQPLFTNRVNPGPQVYYAPAAQRLQVLAQAVIHPIERSWLTSSWQSLSRPLAQWVVAPAIVLTGLAGIAVNLRMRLGTTAQQRLHAASPVDSTITEAETLPRHRAGMRFLHWFNLLSWMLLLTTGTALMSSAGFALFGIKFPAWLAERIGGHDNLIWFHAAWGLLWTVVIIPLFIYFKRGGIEALREIWPSYDDVSWLWVKPLVMRHARHV